MKKQPFIFTAYLINTFFRHLYDNGINVKNVRSSQPCISMNSVKYKFFYVSIVNDKKEQKFLIVIFRDIIGSVFANINDVKKPYWYFSIFSTKALSKFEFKCLMSGAFSQMSLKNFPCEYLLLQISLLRKLLRY